MNVVERFIEFVYRILSQPWVNDWRKYTATDEEFKKIQEKLGE